MQTVSTQRRDPAGAVPRPVVTLVEILAVAVLAFVIARGFWFLMYGAFSEPFTFEEPDIRPTIRETRLQPTDTSFDHLFSGTTATPVQSDVEALPETQLSLRLYGVRMGQTPTTGSAIVEAGANGQRTYAVGQFITEDASLAEVYADRIIIERAGVREVLYLREGAARTETSSGIQAVTDPQALIAALALQPNFDRGELNGFRVSSDSNTAASLGLIRGDIILAINGRDIPSEAEAAARFVSRLQSENSLQLTVRRDGERITLDVPR